MKNAAKVVAALGGIAFLIAYVVTLFISDLSFLVRILIALQTAAMTMIAAAILLARDTQTSQSAKARARSRLLAGGDASQEEFEHRFPDLDADLIYLTRMAIASYFDVPVTKIRASLDLNRDLEGSTLIGELCVFVVNYALQRQGTSPRWSLCFSGRPNDLRDLARAIQNVQQDARLATPDSR